MKSHGIFFNIKNSAHFSSPRGKRESYHWFINWKVSLTQFLIIYVEFIEKIQ